MNKENDMSKHTPGPWLSGTDDRYVREERSGATIALVCDDDGHCDVEHRHDMPIGANARLIAAAPDLLAVAQRIALTSPVVRDSDYNAIIDAINKATGSKLPKLSDPRS